MPVLEELGPMLTAVVAAILAIAADIIIKAIGDSIGKVGIGPVTFNIGSFFANKASDVINWAISNLDQYFSDIGNWFIGHILVLQQLGGAAVSAIGHAFDYSDHIVQVVVPNAISAAESAAGKHAQSLVDGVERDLTSDYNTLTNTLKGDVKAIDSTISNDVTSLTNLVSKSVTTGVAKAEGYTDDAINTLTGVVKHDLTVAENYTDNSVGALSRTLGQQLSNLTDTVANNLTKAEDYAKAQATTVYQEVEGDLTQTTKTLTAGITTAVGLAQTGIADAAADLSTAEKFTTGAVNTGVSDAEQFASQAAGAAASTAGGALQDAFGGLYTDLTGQALAVNGDLSTVEGLIAGAILTSVGAIAARVAKLEECSVGVCDDSPNNFGSLLKDALGFVEFAGVGAFLAQLISDPTGAANEYGGAVQGFIDLGEKGLHDLLSL